MLAAPSPHPWLGDNRTDTPLTLAAWAAADIDSERVAIEPARSVARWAAHHLRHLRWDWRWASRHFALTAGTARNRLGEGPLEREQLLPGVRATGRGCEITAMGLPASMWSFAGKG